MGLEQDCKRLLFSSSPSLGKGVVCLEQAMLFVQFTLLGQWHWELKEGVGI